MFNMEIHSHRYFSTDIDEVPLIDVAVVPVTSKSSTIEKPKRKCGFGTCQQRFGRFFMHPGLDTLGLFQAKSIGCDPALYAPVPMSQIYKVNKNSTIVPWAHEVALQEWSANLGYRNKKVLINKKREKRALGPAWHEVPDKIVCGNTICRNVDFGRCPRSSPVQDKSLPPGIHYKAKPFKAEPGPHSKLQSFDWSHPCRFHDQRPSWSLACNRYTIRDKESIEWKPRKLVSKRGPYDLFSGDRGDPVITHYPLGAVILADSWPYTLPSSLDTIKKSLRGYMKETGFETRSTGRNVLTDPTLCYRDPSFPCAASYDVAKQRVFKECKYGFNIGARQRVPIRTGVWPGVGRYRWKDKHTIPGHGHRHVFRSVVKRTMGAYLPKPMNSF